MVLPSGNHAIAVGQLEAGRAAIKAGAVETGLQCLRRAVTESLRCRDAQLSTMALLALGSTLIHTMQARNNEGAIVLHQAIESANQAGDRTAVVTACRELAYAEIRAGRPDAGEDWLARAQEGAETDEELAAVAGVWGISASDQADYPAALAHLDRSIEWAARCADDRQRAWSLTLLARVHLLRADHDAATAALTHALAIVHEQRWLAFWPFPQALQAEVDLQTGATDRAADGFERALAIAQQVGDPCWEGLAARGLGLQHAQHGDYATARNWLTNAARRCNSPDRYTWMYGYVLDAAVSTALNRDDTAVSRPLAATLAALAAHSGHRELLARAQLHLYRLGDEAALASAQILSNQIDNPALSQALRLR
jgi:tetratricopeptide (TPR) repeat protein